MGGGRLGEASNLLPEALLLSPSSENSAALSDAILSGTIRPLNESPSTSSHRAEIRPFPPQVLSLIHISEPTRPKYASRMPSSA